MSVITPILGKTLEVLPNFVWSLYFALNKLLYFILSNPLIKYLSALNRKLALYQKFYSAFKDCISFSKAFILSFMFLSLESLLL